MSYLRVPLALLLLCVFTGAQIAGAQSAVPATNAPPAVAQDAEPTLDVQAKTDAEETALGTTNIVTITNGVVVRYRDTNGLAVLEADRASINETTGDIYASGSVRIQKGDQTWVSDQLHYNYLTQKMDADTFRAGRPPFYFGGEQLRGVGEGTNGTYHGTNSFISTDDQARPLQKIRAKHFTIVLNKYVEAYDAFLCINDVPVFYFPYYRRRLTKEQDEFTFVPGYRSLFGPYLLSSYNWMYDEHLKGALHLDYRESRGVGGGPDVNFNYGQLGEGTLRYYFARDQQPGTDPNNGSNLPNNRFRTYFAYDAHPLTNLTVLSQVGYQSDPYIVRDFFESQYNKDTQPNTFFDANQAWQNWSLDAMAQTRVNPFWESVERLPEVRLSGFRQQIFDLPVFYESESSAGYFRREFANTNSLDPTNFPPFFFPTNDFAAARADTFHQLTMPETFFGWLNVTPRVGARYTYYGSESGAASATTNATTSHNRTVFETGAEVSFTASRLWRDVESSVWDVDGLRHIFQPSLNYVYIPQPSVLPSQLPQFDYAPTNNLRLLPLEFPENNSIDSINSENTIRYGLNNRLQTKRNGEIDDLASWSVYVDWHLRPRSDQTTFSDIFSDFSFKPRSWMTLQSFTRYSVENGQFNLAQHSVTLTPNNTWNWTVSHLYLRGGASSPFGLVGDDLFSSVLFYRFDENWGLRTAHYFDATSGTLEEQDYSIYRDLRSWTCALTFRALNSQSNGKDYGVAFTFSFKSFPHFAVGADSVRSAALVGY